MYSWFLKKIYKLLIFKITIFEKEEVMRYNKLETFCQYTFNTNMGAIYINFKEDRRKNYRRRFSKIPVKSFLIELEFSNEIKPKYKDINKKVVIVSILNILTINRRILAELLLDLYVDAVYTYITE